MRSKMVFKIYEGISCSLFYVKEIDVIVHKKLYNPINFLAILYPKSLANLVVKVGTRHIVTNPIPVKLLPRSYSMWVQKFSQ